MRRWHHGVGVGVFLAAQIARFAKDLRQALQLIRVLPLESIRSGLLEAEPLAGLVLRCLGPSAAPVLRNVNRPADKPSWAQSLCPEVCHRPNRRNGAETRGRFRRAAQDEPASQAELVELTFESRHCCCSCSIVDLARLLLGCCLVAACAGLFVLLDGRSAKFVLSIWGTCLPFARTPPARGSPRHTTGKRLTVSRTPRTRWPSPWRHQARPAYPAQRCSAPPWDGGQPGQHCTAPMARKRTWR